MSMLGNLAHRHWHSCPGCLQSWECYVPGGCREEKERSCRFCEDDPDEDLEDDE